VPYPKRFTAAALTATFVAMCAACGSTTIGSAGPISHVNADCGLRIPAPGGFAELPGFTVTEICPADVDPAFASQQFQGLAAGVVSQNGNPILKVLVGQLKNGSGDAFIDTYVGNVSNQTREGVGVPQRTRRNRSCPDLLQQSATKRWIRLRRQTDGRHRLCRAVSAAYNR
jgi:hypothetical protein